MNYYLTGIEGMPRLLDCSENPMPEFKKKVYAEAFQKKFQQNVPTFDAIEEGYKTVIDKEQFLINMATALAEHATAKVNKCRRRGDREKVLMDLNLGMAVFVLPMVLEYHGESSKPLADKILEAWKKEFPKTNLQAAEYSYIEKGFHKKFCYITTAVCETFGKSDDCYELTLLRDYRDTYLASLPQGDALIQEYYDIAPTIVKHINSREDAREIYRRIWDTYLSPCIHMIEQEKLEDCRELYEDMVHTLQDKYFFLKN
ncbi:MAG TPA: hypothetical protein IAB31_04525 [Candidatus Choladousia intestinavium]|uniref:Uncharacterized protein n=1 Tax=Candidatus Choladousia intestinavium TaxID=2840727 RepID=A0A9D1D8D3_9FIRM|nr:hypothetical protein [Candidatus Choladousia intestinavium]